MNYTTAAIAGFCALVVGGALYWYTQSLLWSGLVMVAILAIGIYLSLRGASSGCPQICPKGWECVNGACVPPKEITPPGDIIWDPQ